MVLVRLPTVNNPFIVIIPKEINSRRMSRKLMANFCLIILLNKETIDCLCEKLIVEHLIIRWKNYYVNKDLYSL